MSGELDNLLTPDVVLPGQTSPNKAPADQGTHRLMVAVLEDALRTIVKGRFAPGIGYTSGRRQIVADAWEWVADNSDHPFSFVWLCEALGINAEVLRAQIKRGPDPAAMSQKEGREGNRPRWGDSGAGRAVPAAAQALNGWMKPMDRESEVSADGIMSPPIGLPLPELRRGISAPAV